MRTLLRALAGVVIATGALLASGAFLQSVEEEGIAPQTGLAFAVAVLAVAGGAWLWRAQGERAAEERSARHARRLREVAPRGTWLTVSDTAQRAAMSEDEAARAWRALLQEGAAEVDSDAAGRVVYRAL